MNDTLSLGKIRKTGKPEGKTKKEEWGAEGAVSVETGVAEGPGQHCTAVESEGERQQVPAGRGGAGLRGVPATSTDDASS